MYWKYAAKLQENTHAKVWFQYVCIATSAWMFSCNLVHIFRIPFRKNASGGLLLERTLNLLKVNFNFYELRNMFVYVFNVLLEVNWWEIKLRKFLFQIMFEKCNKLAEAVAQTCSIKKVFLEILQNSQENTGARVSFLIKLQASATLLKRDSDTVVFLWILQNY